MRTPATTLEQSTLTRDDFIRQIADLAHAVGLGTITCNMHGGCDAFVIKHPVANIRFVEDIQMVISLDENDPAVTVQSFLQSPWGEQSVSFYMCKEQTADGRVRTRYSVDSVYNNSSLVLCFEDAEKTA